MANSLVTGIISLTLGAIMLTNVMIPIVKGANQDGWTSAEQSVYGMVTLGGIIGLAYGSFVLFGLA